MSRTMSETQEKSASHNPEFISALGELTIEFPSLEEVLREIIWGILGGNEERAQILTASLSIPSAGREMGGTFCTEV